MRCTSRLRLRRHISWAIALTFFGVAPRTVAAEVGQDQGADQHPGSLKKLSIDDLLDVKVTSVSKRPERLAETASAIQIITQDDIRRSGATCIPEALRLVSNLHVARIDSHQWAITARGFNASSANKLLVMIDGRTVYTPLFSGVFWDVQDTLMEDIDRIEVISGSGGTLWGANAVNGVINIITKGASDTKGVFVAGGVGTELRNSLSFRYGGKGDDKLSYRVYGKLFDRDSAALKDGTSTSNPWSMSQGGFRLDWEQSKIDSVTLQGDLYDGEIGSGPNATTLSGGNLLARYTRTVSETSNVTAQLYYDNTHRKAPGIFGENLDTIDLDVQYRMAVGDKHDLMFGLGYRRLVDDVDNSSVLAFLPGKTTRQLFSSFIQDEIALQGDRLHLTLGAKLEHNDYTGLEFQPSVRAALKVGPRQTLWGAISRAVRTPSRYDSELFIPGVPPFLFAGGPNFESETMIGYELGYRTTLGSKLSLSAATYFNTYDKIRSLEQVAPPVPLPLEVGNGFRAQSYGVELTADYQVTDRWRLHAGYTHSNVKLWNRPGSTDPSQGVSESNDPSDQFLLRSSLDLPGNVTFDAMFRYVGKIKNQDVPAYSDLNLRLAWAPRPGVELSIVGQNLLRPRHGEFGAEAGRQYVERGLFGSVTWRF